MQPSEKPTTFTISAADGRQDTTPGGGQSAGVETLSTDIKTLADWVFQQFSPISPVKVKNILDKPFEITYCVGEDVVTPDPVTRNVLQRQYEVIRFAAGEEKIIMGAAAYLFVDKVAKEYVFIREGGESDDPIKKVAAAGLMANVAVLIEAAKLAISHETITYATSSSAQDKPSEQLVNAGGDIKQETATTPPVTPPGNPQDDALDALNGGNKTVEERFTVVPPDPASGRKDAEFYMDGEKVTSEVWNDERNKAVQASA